MKIVLVYQYLLLCNLFSKAKKRCSRRVLTRDPTVFLENPTEYPHKQLPLFPETRIPAEDLYCWQYVSIFVSFTQLFSEVARCQPAKPPRKQNLTRNSQSMSFKVMHFGITEKATTNCISPYNNAGHISKVSENIASENAELAAFSTTTLSFDASSPGNLREYSHKSYTARVIGLNFCRW